MSSAQQRKPQPPRAAAEPAHERRPKTQTTTLLPPSFGTAFNRSLRVYQANCRLSVPCDQNGTSPHAATSSRVNATLRTFPELGTIISCGGMRFTVEGISQRAQRPERLTLLVAPAEPQAAR